MKSWSYSYRTSDGLKHEAEMEASTKDEVYETLRKRGIKAIKVVERIQPLIVKGVRKRVVMVIVALAVILAFALGYWLREDNGGADDDVVGERKGWKESFARPRPRRQLSVDVSQLPLERIFTHPSERFLAQFAQPGKSAELMPLTDEVVSDFAESVDDGIVIENDDEFVVAELKRIVVGMKVEARVHLKSGKGVREFAAWLFQRQKMENAYRNEILRQARERGTRVEEVNETLDSIGFERTEGLSEGGLKKP